MDKNSLMENWFKNTKDMVFFKDLNGKYLFVSDSCKTLAGLDSPEEMIGKYDMEIYPTKLAQSFIAQDKQVKKSGEKLVDIDFVSNDTVGDIVIESVKMPLYDENGEIIGVQGIARDITERYHMQEKMRNSNLRIQTIVDSFPLPYWIKTKDNRYAIVNKSYSDFFDIKINNIEAHNVSTTLTINKIFDEENMEKINKHDAYTFKTQKPSKITVVANIKGKTQKLEMIKMPVSFLDETIQCLAGIAHII